MTDYRTGGRRRLDRVLDPALLERLTDAHTSTLDAVQGDAVQEEAELSYVRRLLQGRLDQVRDEQQRRLAAAPADGAPAGVRTDDELVSMLSGILAERRSDRGAGRYVEAEADHDGQRRREAEVAAADLRLSDPGHLDDEALEAARVRLAELEARVSGVRHELQVVVDAVTVELGRRVQVGPPPAPPGPTPA